MYLGNSPNMTRQVKSTNYTAVNNDWLAIDTTSGVVTITLPANPTTGHFVQFADSGKNLATNNLTVARNGQTIEGLAEDMTVSTNGSTFGLFFNGTTWRVY